MNRVKGTAVKTAGGAEYMYRPFLVFFVSREAVAKMIQHVFDQGTIAFIIWQ